MSSVDASQCLITFVWMNVRITAEDTQRAIALGVRQFQGVLHGGDDALHAQHLLALMNPPHGAARCTWTTALPSWKNSACATWTRTTRATRCACSGSASVSWSARAGQRPVCSAGG